MSLRDLDQIRSFIAGGGLLALFDLPWIPVYLLFCFALHFWIGATATLGAIVLFTLTLVTELRTRKPAAEATLSAARREAWTQACLRNAEAATAMAMKERLLEIWEKFNRRYLIAQEQAHDTSGGFGALSKALRMLLQSAVLAVGAYLVIHGQATAGIIIAGSILSARALAPVELAIAHWRGFQAARQGAKRLGVVLAEMPTQSLQLSLPKPSLGSVGRKRQHLAAGRVLQRRIRCKLRHLGGYGAGHYRAQCFRQVLTGPCIGGGLAPGRRENLSRWRGAEAVAADRLSATALDTCPRKSSSSTAPLRRISAASRRMHPPRTLLLRQKQPACMR